MKDPPDLESYLKRYHLGSKVEGYGIDVRITSPCPFCAAPDWMTWKLLGVRQTMEKGAVCRECGRGARAIFAQSPGSIQFELVQTCGVDPPAYLEPKMRRAS